jgi:hypothetical protein
MDEEAADHVGVHHRLLPGPALLVGELLQPIVDRLPALYAEEPLSRFLLAQDAEGDEFIGLLIHLGAEGGENPQFVLPHPGRIVLETGTRRPLFDGREESEIGAALFHRYVATVLEESPIADLVLESVQMYLAKHRRIRAAADALLIHSNTLRYRLEKYTSITGADLTDTEAVIEVWWALEYWQVRRDGGSQPGPLAHGGGP